MLPKYFNLNQTRSDGAEPHHQVIAAKQPVPLTIVQDLYTDRVVSGSFEHVSVAVERQRGTITGNRAYVAGITEGTAMIYTAELTLTGRPKTNWLLIEAISDVDDIAIAFDGIYEKQVKHVEFFTNTLWIVTVTANHELCVKPLNGQSSVIAQNISACDAIMGLKPQSDSGLSQGFIIAYVTVDHALNYKQYDTDAGQWAEAIPVVNASNGQNVIDATDIVINRTWDYRLAFTWTTTSGEHIQQLTRSVPTGFANAENIELKNSVMSSNIHSVMRSNTSTNEHVELVDAAVASHVYPLDPPIMIGARNLDDGTGNFGLCLEIDISLPVGNLNGSGSEGFFVTDGRMNYNALSVTIKPGTHDQRLILTCADFNNVDPTTAQVMYNDTVGQLISFDDVTPMQTHAIGFMPMNLVPVEINPPIVKLVTNIEGSEL